MIKKIQQVRINYKSGRVFIGWFDKFNLDDGDTGDGIRAMRWAHSYIDTYFLYAGLGDIESVSVVGSGYRFMRFDEVTAYLKRLFR